ncbi:hypothetical protein BHE74_00059760, partial [Ensete ventricosum]
VKKQYNNETLFLRPLPTPLPVTCSPFRLLEPRRISIELQRSIFPSIGGAPLLCLCSLLFWSAFSSSFELQRFRFGGVVRSSCAALWPELGACGFGKRWNLVRSSRLRAWF